MAQKETTATQAFVEIDRIYEDTLILKSGGLRKVLLVSGINTELKSEQEQNIIYLEYQNFLNSVDFPLQIMIQSRKLNVEPYLTAIHEYEKVQENELLKVQTSEYIEFVREFVELSNIMTKNFYVVIPFNPSIADSSGASSVFGSLFRPKGDKERIEGGFDEYKIQLLQRVDSVQLGLQRLGVRTVVLKTDELIELFYGMYNLQELEKGKAGDADMRNAN